MAKALLPFSVLTACIAVVISQCFTKDDTRLKDRDIDLAAQNLVEGSTRFSLTLLKALNHAESCNIGSKGMFFSPHSIWLALLITYMGSQGITEQEMRNVLGINDIDKVTTWEAIRNIHSFIPYTLNNSRELSYTTANRIYFQEGTTLKDCVQEQLNNDIAFVDFRNNPDRTRDIINLWVENQTQNRIKEFIPPGGINSLTNILIANAVYFNKAWIHPFKIWEQPWRFTTSTGKNASVTLMYRRGKFRYVRNEDLQCSALEIPYVGSAVSMIILLPKYYDGVDILANQLTPERLRNLLDNMHVTQMSAMIPKFKFEGSYELRSALRKMGLRTLFDSRRVDLSGFTGRSEFLVDSVYHKSFIDVNEKGTEAAAATRTAGFKSGILHVRVNHPFIYIIRDNLSGAILFLGTVREPTEFGST